MAIQALPQAGSYVILRYEAPKGEALGVNHFPAAFIKPLSLSHCFPAICPFSPYVLATLRLDLTTTKI